MRRPGRLYRLILMLALVASAALPLPLRAQLATLPAMQAGDISVSGLSSGAYMAVQFDVAYSSSVKGAGVIAGGPYSCARGNVNTATSVCSCTGLGVCKVRAGGTNVADLATLTSQYAADGSIDPVAGLGAHRIWLFSGSADTLVPQAVMNDLADYYRRFTPAANISYRNNIAAQHAMPTDSYGKACGTLGAPYINNCAFDAAGELLQWIYGSLSPRSSAAPGGRLLEFDQGQFLPDPTNHGMAASGFLYVPQACDSSQGKDCKLHVAFHGCQQDARSVGDKFILNTGYIPWADSNRIMLLFPQAAPVFPMANPNACWDWWSYDDANYARKNGRQMAAVKLMTARLTGGTTPPPPPPPEIVCYTASNAEHVHAGRAYDRFFFAYAQGSGQLLGLDSRYVRSTLRRTAPDQYVIGTCP